MKLRIIVKWFDGYKNENIDIFAIQSIQAQKSGNNHKKIVIIF